MVYIDESGDLGFGPKSSTHLIITALVVSDSHVLERIAKKIRRNSTFKKGLKESSEFKGNKISEKSTKIALSNLNTIHEFRVIHIIFEKQKLKNSYLRKDKHNLYNHIAGKLAEYIALEDCNLIIRIDKSKGKQALIDDFNRHLELKFKEAGFSKNLEIHHSYSHSWIGLQMVDLLAWAEFQKICKNKDEYIRLINAEKQEEHDVFIK
ncbi:DUF3800 domain-containing protein [Methanimicrococcus hongohii]|uniref:DUF3800 domain-containing protein n=1 Tax=Methanimicrococcus hongohii TaxID=3028295 RepID=UPI00292CA9F9|nr:DUF3800 domain-containing protein [Methanimicrococcus sp. Hf6]